jgi:ABC-type transporter Mla subunit MlaD
VQLDEIVNSVNKVAEIIAEITAASQEQSTGIEQVNQAVNQLDQITQQNAASVEELAATSQAMSDQAQDLQSVVKQFKTNATNVSHLRMVTSENPAPIARRPEKVAVGQNASKMPAAPSKKKPSSPPRALQSSETLEF